MKISILKKNSLTLPLALDIFAKFNDCRHQFFRLARESLLYRKFSFLKKILYTVSENSVFGRFAKTRCSLNPELLLGGSWFVGRFSGFNGKIKEVFSGYLTASRILQYCRNNESHARFFWFRNTGITVVAAVAVNLILSFIFKQKIGATGYIFRSVLLFLGLAVWFGEKQ